MAPAEFKQARKDLGLTQAALAQILKVDPSTLRRWEMEPERESAIEPNHIACLLLTAWLGSKQLRRSLNAIGRKA